MTRTAIALGLGLTLAAAAPAWAEHNTAVTGSPRAAAEETETTLDLSLKIGADGFRLGTRLFGVDGVHGAWINGRVLPYGFSLDGRVQGDGRTHNFKMNLDLEDLLRPRLTL